MCETVIWLPCHTRPNQGLNPQPGYVPCLGIEPTTLWSRGWCSNQLSHTGQAPKFTLLQFSRSEAQSTHQAETKISARCTPSWKLQRRLHFLLQLLEATDFPWLGAPFSIFIVRIVWSTHLTLSYLCFPLSVPSSTMSWWHGALPDNPGKSPHLSVSWTATLNPSWSRNLTEGSRNYDMDVFQKRNHYSACHREHSSNSCLSLQA